MGFTLTSRLKSIIKAPNPSVQSTPATRRLVWHEVMHEQKYCSEAKRPLHTHSSAGSNTGGCVNPCFTLSSEAASPHQGVLAAADPLLGVFRSSWSFAPRLRTQAKLITSQRR